MLRARLARWGSAGPALAARTVRGVLAFASGQGCDLTTRVITLANEMLRSLVLCQMKGLAMKGSTLLLLIGLGVGMAFLLPGEQGSGPARAASPPTTDRQGDLLPPHALARMGSVRWRHRGQLYGLTYSPDGRRLISGSFDGTVYLWDANTGKQLRRFQTNRPGLYSLALSADGKTLAVTADEGKGIRTWDLSTGKEDPPALVPGERVRALGFAGRDGMLLSASWHKEDILLQEARTGKVWQRLRGHNKRVLFSAFSPDGQTLVSAGEDNTVRLWRVANGAEVCCFRLRSLPTGGLSEGDIAFAFSPDGTLLAAGLRDHRVLLFRVSDGKEVQRLEAVRDRALSLAFSPDGKTLAAGGSDNTIHRWDVRTGKALPAEPGHRGGLLAVVLIGDGRFLASAGADSTVRLWETATGREVRQWQDSPRQQEIASVQDPLTHKVHRQFESHPWIASLACTPDGTTLAGGSAAGLIYCWDLKTGREVKHFRAHTGKVRTLAFLPGAKRLVSGSEDGTVAVWAWQSGKLVRRIETRQGWVLSVAFPADGKTLATMGWNWGPHGAWLRKRAPAEANGNTIRFWDTATGVEQKLASGLLVPQPAPPFPGFDPLLAKPPATIPTVTFSPDGNTLASLGFDGVIRLWERTLTPDQGVRFTQVRSWKVNLHPKPLLGAEPPTFWLTSRSSVDCLVFSPDGKTLAVEAGSSVLLYEVASGKQRLRLTGHHGKVSGLVFNAAGTLLASGSRDFTALVWDLTGGLLDSGRLHQVSLTNQDRERLWADLASHDAEIAYRAIWSLAAGGRDSVAFLKERLSLHKEDKPPPIGQWIAELNDARFRVRERASQNLERLGRRALPALRQALVGRPKPEARRRIKALIEKLSGARLSPEELRTLRAIEVLEHLGSA